MIAKILVSMLLISSAGEIAADAAAKLTLEEALSMALEASEELHIKQEEVRIAEFQAAEAGSRRWPQLDFSSQYVFTSEVMKFVQPSATLAVPQIGSVTIPGKETAFGDEHTVDFKLQATQPLFTGLRLKKAHRAAAYQVRQKQAEVERLRREVGCQTEELYVTVQKLSALKEVTELRVQTLQRHLQDAGRRVDEGVAPQEVKTRAEFALSQAELRRQEARHALQMAEISLREFLNLPDDGQPLQLDSLSLTPFDADVWSVDFALANRSEFEALNAQEDAVEQQAGIEKAAYYPTLMAFGAVDYGRPGVDRLANEWMFYEMAGLSLNWTLWDWKGRQSRVEQVRAVHRQLQESRIALQSRVRLEVKSARLIVENTQKKLEVADQGLRLSRDVLRWVEARYSQGTATETEYLDAQSDYSASQMEHVVSLGDYRLALVALKRAAGASPAQ